MLRVALTGGIATGKSYIRARLAELSAATIDADVVARDVVAPGQPALAAIVARFGPVVLTPRGDLDRRALGAVVFQDDGARRALEAIVHPAVYAAIAEWLEASAAAGRALAVADIPLLYETGREGDFDRVIVAACSPDEQVRRVVARDKISEGEARQRLAAQWPIERKTARADFVIDTSGSFEETDRQVEAAYRALVAVAGGGSSAPS